MPSPLPSKIESVLSPLLATAKSSLPSSLKSAVVTPLASEPAGKSDLLSKTEEVASVIGKNSTFDMLPPGLGFTTVTEAVLAVAMSEARMVAVNCELFTKVVARALPFQFTTDPDTNPVPFTVSVNLGPPGGTASGTSG